MSISSTTNRNDYVGNGAVDTYSYTFRIIASSDLRVTVRDTNNVETTLALNTDYTVSGVGEVAGGSVALVNSGQSWLDGDGDLKTGYELTIRRVRPLTQTTDIRNQGDYFPETHEDAFDHFIMVDQQQQDEIDRSVRLPETLSAAEFDAEIPSTVTANPGKALGVNDAGTGLALITTPTGITLPVSIANGGTNSGTALNNNRVMKSASGQIVEAAAITASRVLISDANGIPTHNAALTASRALASDSSGFPVAANPTTTELNYLAGVTSAIQSQLDNIARACGRNRIINGDMRIDQRNAGAAVTINSTTGGFGVDRWGAFGQAADGVFTLQRSTSTPPTGFTHFLRVTVTTADASVGAGQNYYVVHPIEGNNVADMDMGKATAKTITLSFWVRSSQTGTFAGGLLNSALNRSYVFTYTINATNTWEQKTVTLTLDTSGTWLTDTGAGVNVYFDIGSGSGAEGTAGAWAGTASFRTAAASRLINTLNATLDITGVQFEIGSVATPYEFRLHSDELERCKRYYQRLGGNAAGEYIESGFSYDGTHSRFPIRHPNMRVVPTITVNSATNWRTLDGNGTAIAATAVAITTAFLHTSHLTVTVAAGLVAGQGAILIANATSAYLDISAELA